MIKVKIANNRRYYVFLDRDALGRVDHLCSACLKNAKRQSSYKKTSEKQRSKDIILVIKDPPASAGGIISDIGSVSGLGRSPRGGHSNPLRYSCLENPMDRGAWQATVQGLHE